MDLSSISFLIVDDTKFSSSLVTHVLKKAGYCDIRIASSAAEALSLLKSRPAHILLADWIMPGMDGLELARLVRFLDQRNDHFTYIMLLTAKEGSAALEQAFAQGVDDFISKTDLKLQLLPRILAARRVSKRQNELIKRLHLLQHEVNDLHSQRVIDTESGLNTVQSLTQKLNRYLKHLTTRGGTLSLALLHVSNLQQTVHSMTASNRRQFMLQLGNRLQKSCRVLDRCARLSEEVLAVLSIYPESNSVGHRHFQHLLHDVTLRAYATASGYVQLDGRMTVVVVHAEPNLPDADTLLAQAQSYLSSLQDSVNAHTIHWNEPLQLK